MSVPLLAGRSAIITGASRGLGLAIAKAYVDAGASVMLCGRDARSLEAARAEVAARAGAGQRVEAQQADVSQEPEVLALVHTAIATFGQVHVLVNNAGIYGPMGPTESVDLAEWLRFWRRSRQTPSSESRLAWRPPIRR